MSVPEDNRPRPQYGEYATPEEQRARIVGSEPEHPSDPPVVPAAAGAGSGSPTAPSGPARGATRQPAPRTGDHPLPSPRPTTTAARPTRTADRIISIALLAYGLITVLGAIPQLVDFAGFVDTWAEMAGIDATLADPAAGRAWGIAAAVVYAGGWLLTAVLSWMSLSRRRLTWWIPLVGAIVTFIIVSVLLAVPLVTDPGILDAVSRAG